MLKNYLNVLRRNFARNKAFTLINILGLTMGITCSLIMFLVVKQEFSFNRYHSNLDSLYRIGHRDVVDGREYTQGGLLLVMPPSIKEEIVGLKDITLVAHEAYGLISATDVQAQDHSSSTQLNSLAVGDEPGQGCTHLLGFGTHFIHQLVVFKIADGFAPRHEGEPLTTKGSSVLAG